jgi:hypothetical protein
MSDLIFVALTVAFFALCVAYVRGCDRIVESGSQPTEEGPRSRTVRSRRIRDER